MSLARLLTAGKSLVGGNHSGVRYRMTSPKAMPKFDSAKNPFRSTAVRETPGEELPQAAPLVPAVAPQDEPPRPVESPAPVAAQPVGKAPGWLARWGTRFSGWFSRPRLTLPKAAVARFEKAPVQAELSLERIKVMRNDLSDADLEIVPAKAAPRPTPKKAELAVQPALVAESGAAGGASEEKPGRARAAWERANRLLTMNRG